MAEKASPAKHLKNWMIQATGREIRELAEKSGTSVNYLHQISGGFRSPELPLALSIVSSANTLRELRPALPELSLESLHPPCLSCHYFKTCKGE